MGKIKALMETLLGKAGGVATLDENGNVPCTQLSNAVNKAGDTMEGKLTAASGIDIRGGRLSYQEGTGGFYISNFSTSGKEATFEINAENGYANFSCTNEDGTGVIYNRVLHTGNKPSGSYTGNGSATLRTIETGGIGNFCILRVHGYGISIVTAQGAYKMGSTYNGWTDSAIFVNGVLTLTTTDPYLNPSSVSVEYQVL